MDKMREVIDRALMEVGYLEKSRVAYQKNPSVLYKATEGAGSDNYTKYGYEMHKLYPSVMDFPAAWCDCFVDWVFCEVFGESLARQVLCGDFNDYTVASAQLYKDAGRWTDTPAPGYQIFFRNSTRINHTGLVTAVDDECVYTVEGNTSSGSEVIANGGAVCIKKYLRTNSRIAGYGMPKYYLAEESTSESQSASESRTERYMDTLKKGSKGSQAKTLQRLLNTIGYYCGTVDGDFGAKTESSLIRFQKASGLDADGICGPVTWNKILRES